MQSTRREKGVTFASGFGSGFIAILTDEAHLLRGSLPRPWRDAIRKKHFDYHLLMARLEDPRSENKFGLAGYKAGAFTAGALQIAATWSIAIWLLRQ
jgi:hypothetical protein